MREDDFVRVDHREAAGLDALFLREREQAVEKLLVNFQHLDEFHQTTVRDIQLTVETISTWIRLNSNLADRRQIYRSGELRNVLRLGIARRKGSDADAFLFRKGDAMNFHVFVTAAVSFLQGVATLRTKVALDINSVMLLDLAAQLVRDQMQRFLVHRTVFDRVNCARLVRGPIFEPALEHVDDGRLAPADRSHQQQNAFPHFETLCSRFEILDDSGDWFFDAEKLRGEEVVGKNLVLRTFIQPLDA